MTPSPEGRRAARPSRSPWRRRAGGALFALAALGGGVAVVTLPAGGAARALSVAAATPTPSPSSSSLCLEPLTSPTPTPTPSATPTDLLPLPPLPTPSECPPTPTPSSTSRTSTTTRRPAPSGPSPTLYVFGPANDVSMPPPLPTPGPGSAPVAPNLAVQRIVLVSSGEDPVPADADVSVLATLQAQRGTDTYAVPGARVSFRIVSAPGEGAGVTPDTTESGPTGVAAVTVHTGSQTGDTVVQATSGAAEATLTLHGSASPSVASHRVRGGPVAAAPASSHRGLVVAGLSGFIALVLLGLLGMWLLDRRRSRGSAPG